MIKLRHKKAFHPVPSPQSLAILAEKQNLADGTPAEIQSNPKVLEAYFRK